MRLALTLLGVGAMNSPRYRPAGLLVSWRGHRVALDGGAEADPGEPLDDWLVCDERAELMPQIRRRAREIGLSPGVRAFRAHDVRLEPRPVRHTTHAAYGYLIAISGACAAWIPEFWEFPRWARQANLVFADAAGWNRPIRFAGGVGGHACVTDVADHARRHRVQRLVFAHVGRPSIRAVDRGDAPPYGEFGREGTTYYLVA